MTKLISYARRIRDPDYVPDRWDKILGVGFANRMENPNIERAFKSGKVRNWRLDGWFIFLEVEEDYVE